MFSFLVWKGADLGLILQNLSREHVSQSNYLSICMAEFGSSELHCQIWLGKNFAESL